MIDAAGLDNNAQAGNVEVPLTARPARLLVISPVRNEAAHIERLARSVLAQTRSPDLWVVADDDSRDGTTSVLLRAVGQPRILRVLAVPPQPSGLDNEARLARAAEARAFNWALALVDAVGEFTHVAKLDGDIELPPDYYAQVLEEFERDPALGIAGGCFAEPVRGGWRRVREPSTHVAGALKVYRRDCLEAIGGLREHLGWDTIDETTARMRGFATRSLPDLVARHYRPMGSVGGRLRGRWRYGICAHAAGYPSAWVVLRALKVAGLPPRGLSAIAFLGGFVAGRLGSAPSVIDPEYRLFLRGELRERLLRRRPHTVGGGLDQVPLRADPPSGV